ncbi:MAG: T9SS type A sorting domain-containing protein [Flavobacteriales bacterium]|jgi:hypothetical protein|nr:T9SS type A sorting domain-containing protein [Flavobacteriales bacterium]
MKNLFITLIILFTPFILFAHRGEFASIENVKIEELRTAYVYHFQFENIKQKELKDVAIELVIDAHAKKRIEIKHIKNGQRFVDGKFIISKFGFDIDKNFVQIEVTEIFGKRHDWGGWDSPNFTQKQTNTLYSEFYADAPWRMKKTDESGNLNAIPIHFYLHDAHKVLTTTIQVDYINIRIKNATSSTWGPVLTYNILNNTNYQNMFTNVSPNDPALDIQPFVMSDFNKSPNYTMDFDGDTDIFGDNFVYIDQTYWYFTFNIPPTSLIGMEDIIDIDIHIEYSNSSSLVSDDDIGLRVFRSDEAIPTLSDWYRGDTHLHSMFTQNNAETGLPIESTLEAGKLIGLDWFTSTDHTSDYDNYGLSINSNWDKIRAKAQELNDAHPDFKVIAGQELAVNNAKGKLVHMLAYPNYEDPFSLPFLGDGKGDIAHTTVYIDQVVDNLVDAEGFSYAAHPFSTKDKLPTIPVNGGIWNLGELSFPANGSNFPLTGGEIICNETNSTSDILSLNENEFIKDRIQGAQIWNVRNSRTTPSGSELDPWNVRGNSDPFEVNDSASISHHVKKFRQGQEVVNHINKLALVQKNNNEELTNWKLYISAGADAHGSFNFTNTDDFGGFGDLNTNAVGKLTTVVYCPNGMGEDGEEVLRSLYNGNSTLSDGPIATIGISDNGNDNNSEILMGMDTVVNTLQLDDYFLNINYVSTQEFGDFSSFKIIAGTEDGEIEKTIQLPYANGSRNLSYSLKSILDSIFVNGFIPQEKYFYIRAELQTYKDYSSMAAIYGTNYDVFHSFTNPIWIKLAEVEEVTEFEIDAFPNPFKGDLSLTIKNPTEENVKVNIYNDLGQLVSSTLHYVPGVKTVIIPTTKLKLAKGYYTIRASVLDFEDSEKILKVND